MNGPPKAKKQTRLATNYSFDSQIESKKMLLCFCLFQCVVWKEGEKLRKTFSTSLFRNIRGLCFNEIFQQRNASKLCHTFEILTQAKKTLVCTMQFVYHFMVCSLLSSLVVDRSILLDHFIKHKTLISEECYVAVTLTKLSLYIFDYLTSQKMSKHNGL